MSEVKELVVGQAVIYLDERRKRHPALVTTVWGLVPDAGLEAYQKLYGRTPMVNLVFVSSDEARTDGYGRQIQRESSVTYGRDQGPEPLGRCWLFNDE